MKDVLILRAHEGARLDDATASYRGLSGLDLVVAADERRGAPGIPRGIARVDLGDLVVDAMGLPAVRNWRRLCRDYALYAVRQARPHYVHYWLVEPEVRINAADLDAFFAGFAAVPDDLLAARLGNRTSAWRHHAAMARFRAEVAGCLFPFVRVSGAAIDYLLRRRVELSAQWRTARRTGAAMSWPKDEAFVATELRHGHFACSDLNAHGHEVYGGGFGQVPVHHHAPWFAQPDELIYYPVLEDGDYLARLERMVLSGRPIGPLMDAALASVQRLLGKTGEIAVSPIADGILAILLDTVNTGPAEDIAAVAARHLGGGAPGAPVHQTIVDKPERGWSESSPGDFVRGPDVVARSTFADVPPERLVIKPRSHANAAVEQILAAFPQARFVCVFREDLKAWVRSFVRAFGHTAPMLVGTLASGVRACNSLQERGVDLSVISYEMMTADPAAVVQRVHGASVLTDARKAFVETVLSRDSQAGTSISRASRQERESTCCDQEQQTWTQFCALWREKRPAAAITALHLPY